MKIAVMGAGGIGGYLGARFAEAGEDVHLIARGAHLEEIQARGLRLESPHGDVTLPEIHATSDPSEIGPVDLILFTVKLKDTEAAAKSLHSIIGPNTKIVTLQNGIDSKDIIGRQHDPTCIAVGIIYLAAYIKSPGVIYNPGGKHDLVVDRMGGDAVMSAFFDLCGRSVAVEAVPTDDPEHTLWGKFIALVAFSGTTGISRLPIGAVYEHPETLAFMRQLLDENIALARAVGLDFDASHADKTIELFRDQPYDQKSSMLVDLEAGKPLELPWLSGRAVSLGKGLGIPTPANFAVWAALSAYIGGTPRTEPE